MFSEKLNCSFCNSPCKLKIFNREKDSDFLCERLCTFLCVKGDHRFVYNYEYYGNNLQFSDELLDICNCNKIHNSFFLENQIEDISECVFNNFRGVNCNNFIRFSNNFSFLKDKNFVDFVIKTNILYEKRYYKKTLFASKTYFDLKNINKDNYKGYLLLI